MAFNLRSGSCRRRGISGQGKFDSYVRFDAERAEKRWQSIEERAPRAIQAACAGELMGGSTLEADLRDLVVLHLVRSLDVRRIWDPTKSEHFGNVAELVGTAEAQEFAFRERYRGLVPAGPEGLAVGQRLLEGHVLSNFDAGGVAFTNNLVDTFDAVLSMFSHAQLEIGSAAEGEFLIGDNPSLTYDKDTGKHGLLGGAGLRQSNTVLMPIGPRHLVALTGTHLKWELTSQQVDFVNRLQIGSAHGRVWFRPTSELESFVRKEKDRIQQLSQPDKTL